MNKNRWRNCRSASRLVAKLAEETGEVASAYLDVLDCTNDGSRLAAKRNLLNELSHVRFIGNCLENLVMEGSESSGPIGAREEDNDAT